MEMAVATAAAVVLVGQVLIMRRQKAIMETQLLQGVRSEWLELRPDWRVALILSGSMYQDIDIGLESQFSDLQPLREQFDDFGSEVFRRTDASLEFATSAQLQEANRRALEYLKMVAGLILSGRLRLPLAYEVIGASVVRNGGTLRRMIEEPERSGDFLLYHDAAARRILILLDLLWVEARRADDFPAVDFDTVVDIKRGASGHLNRKRAARESRLVAGYRRALWATWTLTDAEVVSSRSGVVRVFARMWRLRTQFWGIFATE